MMTPPMINLILLLARLGWTVPRKMVELSAIASLRNSVFYISRTCASIASKVVGVNEVALREFEAVDESEINPTPWG
jgi:hypothetical protein